MERLSDYFIVEAKSIYLLEEKVRDLIKGGVGIGLCGGVTVVYSRNTGHEQYGCGGDVVEKYIQVLYKVNV